MTRIVMLRDQGTGEWHRALSPSTLARKLFGDRSETGPAQPCKGGYTYTVVRSGAPVGVLFYKSAEPLAEVNAMFAAQDAKANANRKSPLRTRRYVLVNSQGCVFDTASFASVEEAVEWGEDRAGDYRLDVVDDGDWTTVARWRDNVREEEACRSSRTRPSPTCASRSCATARGTGNPAP